MDYSYYQGAIMRYQIDDLHSLEWSDKDKSTIDGMMKKEHWVEYHPYTISKFEEPELFAECLRETYGPISEISASRLRRIEEREKLSSRGELTTELQEVLKFLDSTNREAHTGSMRGLVLHEGAILELAMNKAIIKLSRKAEEAELNKEYKNEINKIEKEKYVSLFLKIEILKESRTTKIVKENKDMLDLIKDFRNKAAHTFNFNLENDEVAKLLQELFFKNGLEKVYEYDKVKGDWQLMIQKAYVTPCMIIMNDILAISYGKNFYDVLQNR